MSHEFTQRLALSRHAIDRQAHRRNEPELMDELKADAATRVIALAGGKALLREGVLATFTVHDLASRVDFDTAFVLFLGVSTVEAPGEPSGTPFLAVELSEDQADLLSDDGTAWADLRVVGGDLGDRDAGLFTQALALANWHRSHPHSPRNGEKTTSGQHGWVRHPHDDEKAQVFPRTDAAVIVLITDDDDRLLLGNNARWEKNRYSLLAGYVEPGESLESAVIREVFEESGLTVVNPTYVGSQPWPFPASLMLGFTARIAPGTNPNATIADGEEILSLRWFTRDELRSSIDEIILPGPVSIARALIEKWLGEEFPQGDAWAAGR